MNKERKAYRKMHAQHRKEMIEMAKEDREWDYDYLHDIVMTKIRHMYEYYVAGNNVFHNEKSKESIVEQLKHVLDLEVERCEIWEEYYYFDDDDESDQETIDRVNSYHQRDEHLYREIYEYIGCNIWKWWD